MSHTLSVFYFDKGGIKGINNNNYNPKYGNNGQNRRPFEKKDNGDLVNERIRFQEVLVIDSNGTQLGKMTSQRALDTARHFNLDLLCVAPNAPVPVCKILDYGKYRFEQQKAEKRNKKIQNSHIVKIKEIQLSPNIGDHDFGYKLKNAIGFLQDGDKVKISIRFRGREMAHTDLGEQMIMRFVEGLKEYGTLELRPKLEGRNMMAQVISKTKK